MAYLDGGADAGVGGLDVEHGAHGGGDVGHVGQARGLASGDVPAQEDEGNVEKDPDAGKDGGQEEKGAREDEMVERASLNQWA